jgi:hypothetical protein
MTAWLVAIIPVLIMFFALAMERLESRLRQLALQDNAVQGNEVEEFLEAARPEEVRALYGSGIGRALELFRRRTSRARLRNRTYPRKGAVGHGVGHAGSDSRNFGLVTSRRTGQRS